MSKTAVTDENEHISKSQRKLKMLELQKLGKKLTEINQSLLDKCQLPDELLLAVNEHKRLPNKNEARRRHLQFIGKLMRSVDTTQIELALTNSKQNVELEKRKFKNLENIREELIAGNNETLKTLINNHSQLDIQHLRQLIRHSQKELSQGRGPMASRKLFKYLREIILQ